MLRAIPIKGSCLLAAIILLNLMTPGGASSQVYKLPVPDECSSSKALTVRRENHPEKFTSYGKVDLYCGDTLVAKGATFCDSDYDMNKPVQTSIKIAVSSKVQSGKAAACAPGTDLKIVPQ